MQGLFFSYNPCMRQHIGLEEASNFSKRACGLPYGYPVGWGFDSITDDWITSEKYCIGGSSQVGWGDDVGRLFVEHQLLSQRSWIRILFILVYHWQFNLLANVLPESEAHQSRTFLLQVHDLRILRQKNVKNDCFLLQWMVWVVFSWCMFFDVFNMSLVFVR